MFLVRLLQKEVNYFQRYGHFKENASGGRGAGLFYIALTIERVT